MAKINFYLTNKRDKSETKIFCNINYGLFTLADGKKKYLPFKYTTNFKILPELWNAKKNRAKESLKWADADTYEISQSAVEESARKNCGVFNESLAVFELNANRIVSKLTVANRLPRHEQIRQELDRLYNPNKAIGSLHEVDYYQLNLIQLIDHIINTSSQLKPATKKNYKVVRNDLIDYQKKHKGNITPQNADIDFYNSFVKYLEGRGLALNTIGTRIKIIKRVLNIATEKIDNVCQDYNKSSFVKPSEESENIYLNTRELNQLYQLKYLPPYLDRVRDMFLIACDTGLRFSDLIRLTKDNINTDNTISIKTQKTEKTVVIPMSPRVGSIFKKYDNNLPEVINNSKYNSYLKDIAKRANLVEPVNITRRVKGMLVTRTLKKYEIVTSHTARRSFATNAFLNDVPTLSIMQITGHSTESAFMKYIKMTAKDNATKLQTHNFFTQLNEAK